MSLVATINTAIDAAILDVNQFQEVTFSASFTKATVSSGDYDTVTGQYSNTNAATPGKIILPEAALSEIDGESLKVTALQGIVLRSWIPGLDLHADDIVTVASGVFAGTYTITGAPVETVAHFEINLVN